LGLLDHISAGVRDGEALFGKTFHFQLKEISHPRFGASTQLFPALDRKWVGAVKLSRNFPDREVITVSLTERQLSKFVVGIVSAVKAYAGYDHVRHFALSL
jgi:hypothetical protein